jgi:hypothetical protein
MTPGIRVSHADLARLLQRVGYSPEVIAEIASQLPDPIDVDRDAQILERYHLTGGRLMELLGASP